MFLAANLPEGQARAGMSQGPYGLPTPWEGQSQRRARESPPRCSTQYGGDAGDGPGAERAGGRVSEIQ